MIKDFEMNDLKELYIDILLWNVVISLLQKTMLHF